MADSFRLPVDGSIYADTIFSRCRDLISYQIWSGLSRPRLDSWIANFHSIEERYFAARVLDSLIYRSDDQTIALLRHLFCRVIPDQARVRGLPAALRQIYRALRDDRTDPRVRIVPVIPPLGPPTKSAPVIARHLKRALRFHERWIIHPADVVHHLPAVDAIVFVDDFLGTGTQFSRFLGATGLHVHMSRSCFIYGCLAAHESGIAELSTDFPKVNIAAVEHLNDSHALFSVDAGSFPDGINSVEGAKDFYHAILVDRGIDISGPSRHGFGALDLVYAFEHAVPDNSLPILWWDGSEKWRSLFDR